jgi:hypothetical protein
MDVNADPFQNASALPGPAPPSTTAPAFHAVIA